MFISPERLDDPDFIDRANRTYLFGMFAEECGANGDMAREGRVPMARLYVQGVPAVRDLDVLVWNPDEGAPVFGDNPTLVVDRPPKGPDHIGSLHLGMGGHGAVMLVEHGRVRFAIPGIDVDGRFALFDDDRRSLARMDWERTRAVYAYVEGLEAKEVRPGPKPALTDGQLVIIGRIAEREYVPEGTPEPVGGWAALGLVFAWGEEDDGTWTPIHKVGPKPGNLALWERAYAEYRRRQCSVLVPLGLSDTEWLRAVGRMGLTAAVTPPTPTQLEAVKQALKHGHTPVGMKRPEGGWAASGWRRLRAVSPAKAWSIITCPERRRSSAPAGRPRSGRTEHHPPADAPHILMGRGRTSVAADRRRRRAAAIPTGQVRSRPMGSGGESADTT